MLALQTLTPGGTVQTALTQYDADTYAGNPTQAMAHEVVLRTLPGEKVISPLTDLVVVQAGAHKTAQILTESKVNAGVNYTAENALKIAQEANKIVTAPENQDKLDQPNFKPTVSTLFTLTVETPNSAPTIVPKIAEDLQAWIGSIELTQGVAVTNEQYRIDNLFDDAGHRCRRH